MIVILQLGYFGSLLRVIAIAVADLVGGFLPVVVLAESAVLAPAVEIQTRFATR